MLPPVTDDCALHEAAIADLLDRTVPPEDEAALRRHAAGCALCAALLLDAERGQAWARILHDDPPVPPPALLEEVLARTPSAPPMLAAEGAIPHPAFLPVHSFGREHHARALMTAAMAVFSLALSWSMSGLPLRDLAPDHVEAAATRSFYGAKKQVVSFYDNLRVLRELESTVEALRKPAPAANGKPEPSARRDGGLPLLAILSAERTLP